MLRTKAALLLESGGDREQARQCLEMAHRLAVERCAATFRLRAAMALVQVADTPEAREAADRRVREALGAMPEGRDTPDVRAATEWLRQRGQPLRDGA